MSFLRIWFLATGALILLGLIWAFAPILIPIFVMTAGLGVLVPASWRSPAGSSGPADPQ